MLGSMRMARRFGLLAFVWLVCFPGGGQAWEQKVSSGGAPVHWTTRCLHIYLHESGSDDMPIADVESALIAAIETWNSVDCSSLTLRYAGRTNQEVLGPKVEDPVIVKVVFREKYWPYTDFEVAYTKPHWYSDSGELYDADIELDGEGVSFTLDPEAEPYKMDLQSTITHELGHVLGFLENWEDPEATMYGALVPGEFKKRSLNEDDKEGLCTVYPMDAAAYCDPLEPGFLDVLPPEDEGDGGCAAAARRAPSAAISALLLLLLCLGFRSMRQDWKRS